MDSDEPYTIPFEDFGDVRQIEKFGAAAVIHKAVWKSQRNRQVAIKIYHKLPQYKEVNILRKLDHPNIIKFYGVVNPPLCSGIVIEYASGGDLLSFLTSKREENPGERLPQRQFNHWCLDIAVAIQYLHEHHITHKDIKSPNVLISDDMHGEGAESLNRLKICDFGISKELTSTESIISSCYGGCTRAWAAPEVIRDHRLVSQKSDMYSLCVVFWELWTCKHPWSDNLDHDIETKVKQGIFLEIPTDFPEAMKPVILKCWQMERHRRCNIDEVIVCIKSSMSECQIEVRQENKSGNKGNAQSGVISEDIIEKDESVQKQTRLEDQKLDKVPVQLVENSSKSLEISKTDVKETNSSQSSDIKIQLSCDYKKEENTKASEDDDVDIDHDDGDNDTTQINYYQNIGIQSEPKVGATESDERMQIKQEGVNTSMNQVTKHGFCEEGHVAYIVDRFESFNEDNIDSLRREFSGRDENPTTGGRSEVAPMSPVPVYQNLISPVPKINDDYGYVDATCVPPKGKSGEELMKLYEHVEKSYTDLKLVKEECMDNSRFHGILNDGELRHLMTNIYDVERIMSRLYTWFNICRWKIPVISQLITNIIEGGYLQPIINFSIYSQLQMNMLKCIRYGHLDFAEMFRRDSEDMNYRLSLKDLQEIFLKQANWLKKFHSTLKVIMCLLILHTTQFKFNTINMNLIISFVRVSMTLWLLRISKTHQ
ncbi:probable tyrosine-protein kinase DDB_G0283397 [Anneissia japonica]|uniref:probable tyrosine-protein kinase DDB_G0283397 n=1 Tax=Anneissia japonica TaxID=1529436 RepID=UPI0014254C2E|nr:probable tyrosine-protein kinase DDB_G0283397 [Anneissia japonica]